MSVEKNFQNPYYLAIAGSLLPGVKRLEFVKTRYKREV